MNNQTLENNTQGSEVRMSREGIEVMKLKNNLTDMSTYRIEDSKESFKIIGYFHGNQLELIEWDKLTHVNYAFAVPTPEGTIRELKDKELVRSLITTAHKNKVMVGLSVGGWSYNDQILESTFVEATNTDEKCRSLSEDILKLVDDYGFDGVDMDWEYPRVGVSDDQYEYFMTILRQGLTKRRKFLTAAVVGNDTVGAGQTDFILSMLDWINIMSYDGDSGQGHSPYSFALDCGKYWMKERGVEPSRVTLGVPFYSRPSWTTYKEIVARAPEAAYEDTIDIDGTISYYNGLNTMEAKTRWACENTGGIMIWELTQDTKQEELSLLNRIYNTVCQYHPHLKA